MQDDLADGRQIGAGWRLLIVDQPSGKVRSSVLYPRFTVIFREGCECILQAVPPQLRHSQHWRRGHGRGFGLRSFGNIQDDLADGRQIGAGSRLLIVDQSSGKVRKAPLYAWSAVISR